MKEPTCETCDFWKETEEDGIGNCRKSSAGAYTNQRCPLKDFHPFPGIQYDHCCGKHQDFPAWQEVLKASRDRHVWPSLEKGMQVTPISSIHPDHGKTFEFDKFDSVADIAAVFFKNGRFVPLDCFLQTWRLVEE